MIVALLTFIGLGMSTGLLGLAWPSMQKEFNLALDSVNVLIIVTTVAYSVAGFYIGRLMARFGSGKMLLTGMSLAVVCLLATAASSAWIAVVLIGVFLGFGTGIIDAGVNLYIATYHTARQMSWLHACFGLGVTIGPLIMTFVLQHEWKWQIGYAIVGASLIGFASLIAITRHQWRTEGFQTSENKPVRRARYRDTLGNVTVLLSMITFLIYVGAEIGVGQWTYTLLTQSRGVDPAVAGPWVSVYWGTFTGARVFFGLIANRFETKLILRLCMLGMILGAFVLWWNPATMVGLLGLVILGFSQAPIFPMLMSDTAKRVGVEHAENTISIQMGAVGLGAAILPGLVGTIGRNYGLEMMAASFVVMAAAIFICHELTLMRRIQQPALSSATD